MTGTRGSLNAFLDVPQVPVSNAQSGPLAGLRLAVKDIYDVAGYRTGCGNPSKYAEARPAEKSAAAVGALLDAGARFVGKTQTDELAFSLMGQNAHFPHPINPEAPDRVTGGSSSGSAAAVAGRLADIALGSDTGGSIRAPASFCGLIGLRTTHGRIGMEGAMPLAPSFDVLGWFADDIETYETVAKVLFTPTPDPSPQGGGGLGVNVSESPSPLRGGARGGGKPRLISIAALDALVLGSAEAAEYARMKRFVADVLGEPERADPFTASSNELYWCFRRLQAREAWAAHGAWIEAGERNLGPGVDERFGFGRAVDAKTAQAETVRRLTFRAELAGLLGNDGILVMPTVPGAAPFKDASFEALQAYRERALKLLCLSGLSGFPQITLPLGTVDDAPFGLSLLGPAGSDIALIRLGRRLLQAAGKA